MNHYEELGVAQNASTEEIRHAYKSLVRLLHPDQFPDESLKQLAELQMRRLNQMLAVLSDPAGRARYDHQLNAPFPVPRPSPMETLVRPASKKFWSQPWAVVLCAWLPPVAGFGLFAAIMLYYGASTHDSTSAPPEARTEERVALPSAPAPVSALRKIEPALPAGHDSVTLISQLRDSQRELMDLRAERQKLLDELARTGRPPAAEELAPELSPVPKPAILEGRGAAPLPHLEAGALAAPNVIPARLTGHWYYVPDVHEAPAKGVYTPEYIEVRLMEEGGTLRGRYHARYRITDQAISPEVVFQFEGPGGVPSVQLPWSGAGDSKGNVALRLVSADQLIVSWTATRLSAELNLASGTAQLIRQKESR